MIFLFEVVNGERNLLWRWYSIEDLGRELNSDLLRVFMDPNGDLSLSAIIHRLLDSREYEISTRMTDSVFEIKQEISAKVDGREFVIVLTNNVPLLGGLA